MTMKMPRPHQRPVSDPLTAVRPESTLTAKRESLRLIPTDRAEALARPASIGETYLEQHFEARKREQLELHAANGEATSRPEASTSRALEFEQQDARRLAECDAKSVDDSRQRFQVVRELLSPYVHRRSRSSAGYIARSSGLLIGDVAGLSGAAISLGEVPALAVTQALSAGIATITAGLAGAELKHRQLANERRRKGDELPKQLEPYRHLFEGGNHGRGVVITMTSVAALVALLVAVGVYSLRTSVEGSLAGITFGSLAAAIAAASFINSWYHADLIADAIENAHRDYRQTIRAHRRLARASVIRRAEHATAQQRSILAEHERRGKAAAAHIDSLKSLALLASPDVVGHGPASTPVGRKLRKDEAS